RAESLLRHERNVQFPTRHSKRSTGQDQLVAAVVAGLLRGNQGDSEEMGRRRAHTLASLRRLGRNERRLATREQHLLTRTLVADQNRVLKGNRKTEGTSLVI